MALNLIANEGKKIARHTKEMLKVTPFSNRTKFYDEALKILGIPLDSEGNVDGEHKLFFASADGQDDVAIDTVTGQPVSIFNKMMVFVHKGIGPNPYALSKEAVINSNPVATDLANFFNVGEKEFDVYVKNDDGVAVSLTDEEGNAVEGKYAQEKEVRRNSLYCYIASNKLAIDAGNGVTLEGYIIDMYRQEDAPADRLTTQPHPKKVEAQNASNEADQAETGKGRNKRQAANA